MLQSNIKRHCFPLTTGVNWKRNFCLKFGDNEIEQNV